MATCTVLTRLAHYLREFSEASIIFCKNGFRECGNFGESYEMAFCNFVQIWGVCKKLCCVQKIFFYVYNDLATLAKFAPKLDNSACAWLIKFCFYSNSLEGQLTKYWLKNRMLHSHLHHWAHKTCCPMLLLKLL